MVLLSAPPRRSTALPWIALVCVYVFWGSTYLGIRVAVETIPPFTMAGTRYLLAGALLYPIARRRSRQPAPSPRQWVAVAGVALLLLVGGNGLVTFGEQTVESGIAALLVATVPLWMVLFDRVGGAVRLRWQLVVGLLLGLGGIALLVRPWTAHEIHGPGALVILAAAMLWALGSVRSRSAPLPDDPLVSTGAQMLAGGAALVALGAIVGEWGALDVGGISGRSAAAVAWLVGPGSIVGFSAYVYALRTLPTPTVATYAYVNPLVAVALGWAILGERHTFHTLVAGAVIATAVVLIVTFRGRAEAAGMPPAGASSPEPSRGRGRRRARRPRRGVPVRPG